MVNGDSELLEKLEKFTQRKAQESSTLSLIPTELCLSDSLGTFYGLPSGKILAPPFWGSRFKSPGNRLKSTLVVEIENLNPSEKYLALDRNKELHSSTLIVIHLRLKTPNELKKEVSVTN